MKLELIIQQAQQAEKEEQFDKAFELYNQAIAINPNAADLYSWRGVILFHLNRKAEALDDMNKAVELQPDYSYRYSSRAYIKSSLRLTESAIEDYKKCVELDPEDSIAYNNMGMLEEQLGWNKQAQKNFSKADSLENVLKEKNIGTTQEQKQDTDTEHRQDKNNAQKSKIIKDVFTKKETFKEFVRFVKNGFKLKDEESTT